MKYCVLQWVARHFTEINNRNYFYTRTYFIYITAVNTIFKMDEETPSPRTLTCNKTLFTVRDLPIEKSGA